MSDTNNFDSIIAAGRALGAVRLEHQGIPFAVVPGDYSLESIEPFLTKPARKRTGTTPLTFVEVESFTRYVNAHKGVGTTIFAHHDRSGARAVLDWHGADPGWGDHVATLALQPTPAWKALSNIHRHSITQEQFCDFIEDNLALITAPPAADLLEIIQTLEGKQDVQFSQAIKLRNGQVKLGYSESVELKGVRQDGAVELPTHITASCARYKGGETNPVLCRLRYRISERKLTFTVIIDDLEIISEHAYLGVLVQIESATKIKPLI